MAENDPQNKVTTCIRCQCLAASEHGKWCHKCWLELEQEEMGLAQRRNGNGLKQWDMIVDSTRARRYWEARGYTLSTLATTPFRSHIYYREVPEDEAR